MPIDSAYRHGRCTFVCFASIDSQPPSSISNSDLGQLAWRGKSADDEAVLGCVDAVEVSDEVGEMPVHSVLVASQDEAEQVELTLELWLWPSLSEDEGAESTLMMRLKPKLEAVDIVDAIDAVDMVEATLGLRL